MMGRRCSRQQHPLLCLDVTSPVSKATRRLMSAAQALTPPATAPFGRTGSPRAGGRASGEAKGRKRTPDGTGLQARHRGVQRGSPTTLSSCLWKISVRTPTAAVTAQRKRQTQEVTGFKCPTKPP